MLLLNDKKKETEANGLENFNVSFRLHITRDRDIIDKIDNVAKEKKWSISQTVVELLRSSK